MTLGKINLKKNSVIFDPTQNVSPHKRPFVPICQIISLNRKQNTTMTTTITIIILAALLLVAAFILGRVVYISGIRSATISSLKSKINRYQSAADDPRPVYTVRRLYAADNAHEYNGVWAVCRTSFQDGFIHDSCIKIFTDDDDKFNLKEAQELCEKLNEK